MNRKNIDPQIFSEHDIQGMTAAIEQAGEAARNTIAGWKDRSTSLKLSLVRSVRPFKIHKQPDTDPSSTQRHPKFVIISLDEETSP